MRIAQIAPLAEAVPPRAYGGTERVVHWLTEELVRQGHKVTLFASADSATSGDLVPCCASGLRDAGVRDHTASLLVMLEQVKKAAAAFDVLHFHVDLLQFPAFQNLPWKTLTTLHGRLDLPDIRPIYEAFPHMPLVSISEDQRRPMPPVNWVGTVHHGLPPALIPYSATGGAYLAFLGRIAPEKRLDRAIDVAVRAATPLKIAAKVDPADRPYFDRRIAPRLHHPLVEFVGEITDAETGGFLGGALALLFPIDWPEPFGLAMIEAMAAGNACDRLAQRFGPGSRRRRPDGRPGLLGRGSGPGRADRGAAGPLRDTPPLRGPVHGRTDGARLPGHLPPSGRPAGRA